MEVRLGNIFGFTGGNYAGNVYDKNYLAPTLNTMQGGYKQPMIVANINPSGKGINGAVHTVDTEAPTITTNKGEGSKIIVAMRGRNPDNPSDRTPGTPTEQRLEPNSQGLCNTLTSVQKDNLVMENVYDFYNNNLKADGICGTLTSACSHNGSGTFGVIEPQYRIRKLTPMECWLLMDFSKEDFLSAKLGSREVAKDILENYPHLGKRAFTKVERLEKMSNTQLYKQAGNSIVENVLVAILGQMFPGKENVYKER